MGYDKDKITIMSDLWISFLSHTDFRNNQGYSEAVWAVEELWWEERDGYYS